MGKTGKRNELHDLGELALIARIRARAEQIPHPELVLGIGDDCALLRPGVGQELAVTTDLSIAGRHFRLDWHPAESVGHRTLARGLSDLAAMGARPVAAFLSLGLPATLVRKGRERTAWIDRFLDGLLALAAAYDTPLAGGDLAESPLAMADIVLTGTVPQGKALLRSGARPGDPIYVTGSLGGAAAGLELMAKLARALKKSPLRKQASPPPRIPARMKTLLAPHLYPQPRIAQGLWLSGNKLATAAIDLSDGLSTDLMHLCEESRVAAEIDAAALPIHTAATQAMALHGGESYELLFTAAPDAAIPASIEGVAVSRIGRVVKAGPDGPRITLRTAKGAQPLERRGWEHFS